LLLQIIRSLYRRLKMIVDVTVPKWGLTMKEAEIVKWLKKKEMWLKR